MSVYARRWTARATRDCPTGGIQSSLAVIVIALEKLGELSVKLTTGTSIGCLTLIAYVMRDTGQLSFGTWRKFTPDNYYLFTHPEAGGGGANMLVNLWCSFLRKKLVLITKRS